jgi:Tfp pilus assembly protein PilF
MDEIPDPDDQDPERIYAMVDAEQLAESVANLAVQIALEQFLAYMRKTDGVTAREALEHAVELFPRYDPSILPEQQAMALVKVKIVMALEIGTRRSLGKD